jgi:surface protein
MFSFCVSLKSFPDISNWDLSGVNDKSYMFSGCQHDFLKDKIFSDDYNDDEQNYPILSIKADKNNIIRNDDLMQVCTKLIVNR